MAGWIWLHRKLREHWIWTDPIKLKWWLDILLEVNHKKMKVNLGFKLVDCDRGQTIKSLQGWAQRWGVSKDSARHFLRLLQDDNMIKTENLKYTTRITVCNYDEYNTPAHEKQTETKRRPNGDHTETDPNNKDNKDKKVNNENNILFADFWNLYNKKIGDKSKAEKKWNSLTDSEREKIMKTLPAFLGSIRDKQYQPYPLTYLNNRRWEDEIDGDTKAPRVLKIDIDPNVV